MSANWSGWGLGYWARRKNENMTAPNTLLLVDFLHTVRPSVFALLFFALAVAAGETGFRLGRRARGRIQEETKSQMGTVEAAVLGVLGLLLAFTLAMAVARFDNRRLLVLEEANAIGTSYWRTRLVPPPEGLELAGLLREYVDTRLHHFDADTDPSRLRTSRERTARLQEELWSRAAAVAQKDPRSVPAGLLLQSLNETFDLENSRWTARVTYLPAGVLGIDIFIGLLAALIVGYNFGTAGSRHLSSVALLALCISLVLAVILDLDQPQRGLVRVSDQPLIDLQRQLTDRH
jgi:hypothetical protein